MGQVTLAGTPVKILGDFPSVGEIAPSFSLVDRDLNNVSLKSFPGKRKILNIVPSLDTPTCAMSTRKFNETAGKIENTVVIVISSDLPFAMKRFCTTEGITNVITLSTLRGRNFHKDYGVLMVDSPLAGLTARAVVVLDENDKVLHSELVAEIKQEPNYQAALAALK